MRLITPILFIALLQTTAVLSQSVLEKQEIELNKSLLSFRQALTAEQMDVENEKFKNELSVFLNLKGAFTYQFKHLESIAILDSPDKKIRILNWNIEYPDMSYAYGAYLMINDQKKIRIIELNDKLDAYESKPTSTINHTDWYGALYYNITPFEHGNKTEYLLLGWDGGTAGSNFKILDVLVLGKKSIQFGSPVFVSDGEIQKRIIFEYSNRAVMNMRFEEKYGRVVMDHLSPEAPSLEGLYSYYVPDFSYDAYAYNGAYWQLIEDVIAVNDPELMPRSFIQMNARTGKLESKKLKKDWINPTSEKKQVGDIDHVARIPEDQSILEEKPKVLDKQTLRKMNKSYRKDPTGLSVTTGKYKRRKKRQNKK